MKNNLKGGYDMEIKLEVQRKGFGDIAEKQNQSNDFKSYFNEAVETSSIDSEKGNSNDYLMGRLQQQGVIVAGAMQVGLEHMAKNGIMLSSKRRKVESVSPSEFQKGGDSK